ncbi:Uncharacterised protein [Mycobacteroides abscessus subsp. abscessus]|nr:Uncharacterised protein [Mycobacteroides abscessus subsp. abscessus]SID55361.1 Uncharacterised protein [Mycobacteroides abscessus subsp. abscessus]SKO44093.1 Uncharacterised protein [Mycobacteroides abscessus subsp. abscessus]
MSDPAELAAQRHAATLPYGDKSRLCGTDLVSAAREMAKSVQEIHHAEVIETPDDKWLGCRECGADWPCETAKRVYPSEELER